MYELKKNVKVFTSKFVRTGPSSYEKIIYRTAVSQRLRNAAIRLDFSQVQILMILSVWSLRNPDVVARVHKEM